MHPPDADPDEQFDALLAAYDEALAAGPSSTPPTEPHVPPVLAARLQRARACLERLEQDRRGTAGAVPPGEPTPVATAGFSFDLATGTGQLGRFRLRRELGRGGQGIVFLAFDPALHREVALKVPRLECLMTAELRQRFLREARAAASLDHPNLVPVYDVGEAGGVCYIASAYCPGPSLAEWLKQQKELVAPRDAAALIATLAEVVHFIHGRGVVHRDLKPANVLLQRSEVRSQKSEVKSQRSEVRGQGRWGAAPALLTSVL
jgi:hypothetical protein